jgi:Fuc2NAc and GlcNAc transferase
MTIALALLAGVIAYLIAYALIRHADRLRLIDEPNARSSHQKRTPRGGGAGIFAAGLLVGAWLAWRYAWPTGAYVLALSSVIAVIGFLDDLYSLTARSRLAVQIGCCGLLILAMMPVQIWPSAVEWLGLALLLVLGVWWINLFNFMDGIDAIAATQGIFMLGAATILSLLNAPEAASNPAWIWMVSLLAAIVGFLLLNWPPAKIFMGDVGSTYVAFMILAFAVFSVGQGWLYPSTWAILGALFFTDATITLLTRIARGERWHAAHRSHAYQRLSRRWQGHRPVVAFAVAFNVLWILPLALLSIYWDKFESLFILLAYAPVVVGVVRVGGGRPDAA